MDREEQGSEYRIQNIEYRIQNKITEKKLIERGVHSVPVPFWFRSGFYTFPQNIIIITADRQQTT